jgi:hypothetical protein
VNLLFEDVVVELHHVEVEQVLAGILGLKSVVGDAMIEVGKSLVELGMELAVDSVF